MDRVVSSLIVFALRDLDSMFLPSQRIQLIS